MHRDEGATGPTPYRAGLMIVLLMLVGVGTLVVAGTVAADPIVCRGDNHAVPVTTWVCVNQVDTCLAFMVGASSPLLRDLPAGDNIPIYGDDGWVQVWRFACPP